VIQATIIALFVALQKSNAAQIKAGQDREADLWDVLKPSIATANHALDKVRKESPRRAGS
jgi:hypothetical protein